MQLKVRYQVKGYLNYCHINVFCFVQDFAHEAIPLILIYKCWPWWLEEKQPASQLWENGEIMPTCCQWSVYSVRALLPANSRLSLHLVTQDPVLSRYFSFSFPLFWNKFSTFSLTLLSNNWQLENENKT